MQEIFPLLKKIAQSARNPTADCIHRIVVVASEGKEVLNDGIFQ